MKQRFSSLDVKVIAHELNASITGFRVTNIYDLSSRIFLVKFHAPEKKEHLVVDSGFRCHLTSYVRTTAAAPSAFVQRLRKFLKSKRLTAVSQIGTDRVIELQFSDGLYRLYLEFYASGNIVLTDADLKIIALQRNVSEGEAHEQLKLGLQYNLTNRQNYGGVPPLTKERVVAGLKLGQEKFDEPHVNKDKFSRRPKNALRKSLAVSLTELPPMLLDHGLATAGLSHETTIDDVLSKESVLDSLMHALEEASKIVNDVLAASVVKGFILQKPVRKTGQVSVDNDAAQTTPQDPPRSFYDDFHPFRPKQFSDDPSITFVEIDGYNKTVDEFFSSIEGQRLESRLQEREENARRKLDQARADHQKRLDGLQDVQQLQVRKASAIEANLERVDEARAAINGLVGQGMDWVDIARLIENEQRRGNEVAQIIKLPLKLYENTATLLLAEPTFDGVKDDEGYETEDVSDSEDEDATHNSKSHNNIGHADARLAVDIDLELTSWANASQYYDLKRTAVRKEEKTLQASEKALKSTKEKIEADLKKVLKTEKEVLRTVRQPHWFEKFLYFISSEGYLVLGGRDPTQDDLLYRRYLHKGDIYVHADLQGASAVIIKNKPSTPGAPIPPSTLSQAGNLSVCSSQAWDSKAVMSAWWVQADQVSKTTSTGELIKTGGFVIRGTKNFLPPAQLILGFAVMFHISDASKARHLKHRLPNADIDVSTSTDQILSTSSSIVAKDEPTSDTNTITVGPAGHQQGDDGSPNHLSRGSLDGTENISSDYPDDDEEDFPDFTLAKDGDQQDAMPSAGKQDEEQEDEEEEAASFYNPLQNRGSSHRSSNTSSRNMDESSSRSISGHKAEFTMACKQDGLPLTGDIAHEEQSDDDAQKDESQPEKTNTETVQSTVKGGTAQPRGKRGKKKKLATKYADQDEVDRELAMQLLGSTIGQERAKMQAEVQKKQREEEEAQRQHRREQHLKFQKAAEEKRRRQAGRTTGIEAEEEDEGDGFAHDEEANSLPLLDLDAFVGRPLAGDELLAAIPVCAPWQALGNYKYRVKLQPGNEKRGKAVKQILGRWEADGKNPRNIDGKNEDPDKMWSQELELIKSWKDVEVVGVLPVGKMKVMAPGGSGGASAAGGKGKSKGPSGKGKAGKGSKQR